MGAFQFLPTIAAQFSLLLVTGIGWGSWVWLICKVYDRPHRFGWLWCGFVGFAANALFLQAFVYADFPLSHSAWYGLIVAGGGILVLIGRWACGDWRPSRRTRGEIIFMSVVGVAGVALQGHALLQIGPSDYYGRGRYDLANYVQAAEFLSDEPFSLGTESIGLHPWMAKGLVLKEGRITQSIVHGYLAVVAGKDSQQAYGGLSIFCAVIPALAAFALLRVLSLGRGASVAGALWVAWLPAISHMHLEDFLSQVTVLFVFPALAGVWLETRSPSRLAIAASIILSAFLYGAYTEYFPLNWCLLFCVMFMTTDLKLTSKVGWYAVIIANSFLINPYYSMISMPYVLSQAGMIKDPTFLAVLAQDSGTWRGFIRNFFDIDSFLGSSSAVIAALMGLLFCCALGAGSRRRRFILGISATPLAASVVLLAAAVLPKYPFAKLIASFAPIAAIVLSLGIYLACTHLFGRQFRRARIFATVFLGSLAGISAIGTWHQQQAVVAGGYFLGRIDTESMRAARRFMARNPNLTYIIDARDSLVAAWLCYDARAANAYVRHSEIGDIALYSEMFWCRRVPAGLRTFVQVDDHGVITAGEVPASPSVAIENAQQVISMGSDCIYRSNRPMNVDIVRGDHGLDVVPAILEFTITSVLPVNQSGFLHWACGSQSGEIPLTGENIVTLPLDLLIGRNRCLISVRLSAGSRPVSYFIRRIDLSERRSMLLAPH
jgi:hypothetical protein